MTTRFASVLLAALFVMFCSVAQANVYLMLREATVSKTALVTLADLADVRGDDPEEVARLGALPLCPAPGDGRETRISYDMIRSRLVASGANLSQIQFGGTVEVRVRGASIPAPAVEPGRSRQTAAEKSAQLTASSTQRVMQTAAVAGHAAAVSTAATQAMPTAQGHAAAANAPQTQNAQETRRQQLELAVNSALRRHLMLNAPQLGAFDLKTHLSPAEFSTLELSALGGFDVSGGLSPYTGNQFFLLKFLDAQDRIREISVPCEIQSRPLVLVAARPVPRGRMLEAKDLTWRPLEQESERNSVTDPELLIGKEAVAGLRPGQALSMTDVKGVALVHNGEFVSVASRRPGISVQRTMRAKADGSAGDIIPAQTLEDRRTVLVRVTGRQEAETVEAGTETPAPPEIARLTQPATPVTTAAQMPASLSRLTPLSGQTLLTPPRTNPVRPLTGPAVAGSLAQVAHLPPTATRSQQTPSQSDSVQGLPTDYEPPRVRANPVATLSVPRGEAVQD